MTSEYPISIRQNKTVVDTFSSWIKKSRLSRMAIEEENRRANFFQRFMRTRVGWVINTIIQIIPGAGDAICFVSALLQKDIITGERLDTVGVIAYFLAGIIPLAPGTLLVPIFKKIRIGIEEGAESLNKQSISNATRNGNALRTAVKELHDLRTQPTH